jgi:hypothetical protein
VECDLTFALSGAPPRAFAERALLIGASVLERGVRTLGGSCTIHVTKDYLHHCFSQGMPSLFPSIFVPGQFVRKYVASAQDVIWEQ